MPGHDANTRRRFTGAALSLAVALAVVVAVAACGGAGGGAGAAKQLLAETFSGTHNVTSGDVSVELSIERSGSSPQAGPVTVSLGGPFQSRGPGRLPASSFTVTLAGEGKRGSIVILSTGTAGYVMLRGAGYRLPAATFQRLEASFAELSSASSGGSGAGTLATLGIHPLQWLRNATVVGSHDFVGGAGTTHIRAGVDVAALVADLSTFLRHASAVGASGTERFSSGLSASARGRIVKAIHDPTVDVWTGTADKTLRRLQVALRATFPGQSPTVAGTGTAAIGLTIQYAELNQPQTITAPATVQPYTELAGQLRAFERPLESVAGT